MAFMFLQGIFFTFSCCFTHCLLSFLLSSSNHLVTSFFFSRITAQFF